MIAIVDYGMGNLRSVHKAFDAIGVPAEVVRNPEQLLNASAMVLPGVGAFKDCMRNLEAYNLVEPIRDFVKSGRPYLGICLGLQLLFDQSEEFGSVHGLGLLPGRVIRFDEEDMRENGTPLKVPHMGWNQVSVRGDYPLFRDIPEESYFYFVHSFHVVPEREEMIAATTHYGRDFVSGIRHENIHAFQFHPEKSQKLGLQILRNFASLQ